MTFETEIAANTVRAENGCLLWQRPLHGKYPRITRGGVTHRLHRIVCEKVNGPPLSAAYEVMHSCDDPACLEGSHLSWGLHLENMQDMFAKDRHHSVVPPRGVDHHSSQLTEDQARSVRADTRSQRAIAAEYGISQSAVSCIKRGRSWGWLQ